MTVLKPSLSHLILYVHIDTVRVYLYLWSSSAIYIDIYLLHKHFTVSDPVWEYMASHLYHWGPRPQGPRCGGRAVGWVGAVAHRWPEGGCATSRPGRCSSTLSARQCSLAPRPGSPCSRQNSWDLEGQDRGKITTLCIGLFQIYHTK